MIKRVLGRTGLEVTQLGFGAMELRGPKVWSGRQFSEQQAEEILTAVLDAGINFIDTSVDYGASEECIGRYISSRRGEYYLATKCGCNPVDMGDHVQTNPHIWTRDNLWRNIHGSLERLKTDHVDLLQLHNPTVADVANNDVVAVLREIQSQGLARFIGVSTTLPHLPEFLKMDAFDAYQIPYSCLQPEHHDLITEVDESNAGTIIRGGVAKGGPEAQLPARERVDLWEQAGLAELMQEAEDVASSAELILRYTLSHPHVHTVIVGTLNPRHLQENIQAAGKGPLPAFLYREIHTRVTAALS